MGAIFSSLGRTITAGVVLLLAIMAIAGILVFPRTAILAENRRRWVRHHLACYCCANGNRLVFIS